MIKLSLPYLTMLIGLVIPLLVGVVTKSRATATVKTLANLAFSAIAAGITVAISQGGTVRLSDWLLDMLVVFTTSVTAHYHLWKPTGITNKFIDLVPSIGLGQQSGPFDLLARAMEDLNKVPGFTAAVQQQIAPLMPIFPSVTLEQFDQDAPPPTGDPISDAPPPVYATGGIVRPPTPPD